MQSSHLHLVDWKESMIIFSCFLLMQYADLRRRESDWERGPATQRIDGPLWKLSNSCPRTLKTLTYSLSCSKTFSCTLCYQTFIDSKRTYEVEDGGCGLAILREDKPPRPSSHSCTKPSSSSCTCVDQIPSSEYGEGGSLTTAEGRRPPHPSPKYAYIIIHAHAHALKL